MEEIKVGDDVTIKKEYVDAQLDDSFINQYFEVITAHKNLFVLKHELGITLEVPKKYVTK